MRTTVDIPDALYPGRAAHKKRSVKELTARGVEGELRSRKIFLLEEPAGARADQVRQEISQLQGKVERA